MDKIACIERLERIESLVEKYYNRLYKEASSFCNENGLQDSKHLQQTFDSINNEARNLKIGIVGRVKAGKSSLINALVFDGKSILPAAATPMTAALTQISYGENFGVTIDFFTKEDIDNIKKEAEIYENNLQSLVQEKLEKQKQNLKDKLKSKLIPETDLRNKAQESAKRELRNTKEAASADQYNRIKQSSISTDSLTTQNISFSTLEELRQSLNDYVGSSGKYMPFTKSVNISFPYDALKDISIVDTPGLNDPVKSREQRTEEELDKCDVIFIISPAGQFMSADDTDLMDRITNRKGIQELYVVASKFDTQLHGDIKDKANGDINIAITTLQGILSEQLHNTLQQLKEDSPEIGNSYDKLITHSKENTILSSGACYTLMKHIDNIESNEDEDIKHAFKLLQENYPNNFSLSNKSITTASLARLANIDTIQHNLKNVAERKEEIKRQKTQDFIQSNEKIIDDYKKHIINVVNAKQEEIKNSNINDLQNEKQNIKYIKEKASESIYDKYDDLIRIFTRNLKTTLNNKLDSLYKEATDKIENNEGEESEAETKIRDKGTGWFFLNSITGNRYEVYQVQKTIVTIRAGAVTKTLREFRDKIETIISDIAEKQIIDFKEDLRKSITTNLREEIDDDINAYKIINKIRPIIRNIVNILEIPELTYDNRHIPSNSGMLKGSSAERFIAEVEEFVLSLKTDVKNDIKAFIGQLSTKLHSIDISKGLFDEYDKRLEELQRDIGNQASVLNELETIKKECETI